MTHEEQKIELAKLDKLSVITGSDQSVLQCWINGGTSSKAVKIKPEEIDKVPIGCPKYLTSNDAIIRVIRKQNKDVQFKMITASPSQLCEALLRAVGKWKE